MIVLWVTRRGSAHSSRYKSGRRSERGARYPLIRSFVKGSQSRTKFLLDTACCSSTTSFLGRLRRTASRKDQPTGRWNQRGFVAVLPSAQTPPSCVGSPLARVRPLGRVLW